MREFVTAVAAQEDESQQGWIDFKVDGVVCRARRPSPGQVAYLLASMHKRAPLEQQIAGAINFCMAIMDHDSASYLSDKLLDPEDPFEIPQIQDIIEYLVEEWSGRPTEQSSDSSSSQEAPGPTSTPSSQDAETSSTSVSTGS